MAKRVKKLTEAQFWAILRKNGGLFARTARAIAAEYSVEYSRQAVRERALKKPDELADIEEENTDTAEEVLFELLLSTDERVRADAAKFYLKTKGKKRGYIEQQQIEHSGTLETLLITPKADDSE